MSRKTKAAGGGGRKVVPKPAVAGHPFKPRRSPYTCAMKSLLLPTKTYRLSGRLWLETDEGRFLGIGRLELLERIAALGSISKAAQAMGMSYKRAWDLVSSMNTQASTPLVATQTGGTRGGGAVVTPAGHEAIAAFRALQARFQAFMDLETQQLQA